jgi:hypothetical protein
MAFLDRTLKTLAWDGLLKPEHYLVLRENRIHTRERTRSDPSDRVKRAIARQNRVC